MFQSPYCATWNDWVVKAYPCASGQMYYGRGSKQLSWNYNYGAFSQAIFGDAQVTDSLINVFVAKNT